MRILGQLFEHLENRRRREERQTAILLGGGCLVFIVIAIIMAIVGAIFNAAETANVNSTYGEYADSCNPVPQGSEDVANLSDSEPPREILLLIGDTNRRHRWHSELPDQWQAENEEEVTLIGCVQTETLEVEVCEYQRVGAEGDTFTSRITREQQQVTMVILDPDTARRIDSLTILGGDPDICPEDDGEFGSDTYEGADVEWAEFAEWVESYVFDM